MIRTRPATKEYLDNWDNVFGDKNNRPAKPDGGGAGQGSGTKKKRKRKPA